MQDRAFIFGEIHNVKMQLNSIGLIVNQEWLFTPNIKNNIALYEHIIMPNHMHGIIEILFHKDEKTKIIYKTN